MGEDCIFALMCRVSLILFLWIAGIQVEAQHRIRIIDEQYPRSLLNKIVISSEDTDYIIRGVNDTTCKVSITAITNTPKKMEELKASYKVITDLQNQVLRVETFTGDAKGEFLVEINIPEGIALDFSIKNSHLQILNTQNDIHINHHNKDIELRDIRNGKITINTKNGDIKVKNSSGDLHLNTNKTIEAEVLNGSLTALSGGMQQIILHKPIPTMLNAQNGNIKLKIPQNATFDCLLSADIPIKIELNNFSFEGSINLKTMQGKIHQGTTPLKITANKGGIWLYN